MLLGIAGMMAWASGPAVSGSWVLAESASSLESKHEAALQSALSQLPWAFRAIAKGRLAQPISNCEDLVLGLDPTTFRARCDDSPGFERSLADPSPATGADGKVYQVQLEVGESHVVLAFLGEDGGQRTRYERDGEDLLLTKQILSSWFDEPVRWTVRYRRK